MTSAVVLAASKTWKEMSSWANACPSVCAAPRNVASYGHASLAATAAQRLRARCSIAPSRVYSAGYVVCTWPTIYLVGYIVFEYVHDLMAGYRVTYMVCTIYIYIYIYIYMCVCVCVCLCVCVCVCVCIFTSKTRPRCLLNSPKCDFLPWYISWYKICTKYVFLGVPRNI